MFSGDIAGIITAISILLLLFIFCAVIIKRYWIDKKSVTSGSQFIGQEIQKQWQNIDKKKAIEHVIYQKEGEEEEDDAGEDK